MTVQKIIFLIRLVLVEGMAFMGLAVKENYIIDCDGEQGQGAPWTTNVVLQTTGEEVITIYK